MAEGKGPPGCVECGRSTSAGRSGRMRSRCVRCIQQRRAFRFKEYLDRLPPERRTAAVEQAERNRQQHKRTDDEGN